MLLEMQRVIDLTGNIPFDKVDDSKKVIENFCSENIAVLVTNKSANIRHGTHNHNSYEFVICHAEIPSAVIDNMTFNRRNNTLFAVNPMQEHGVAIDLKGFSLCGIHIDKELVQNSSMEMYGSPNIVFSNDSFVVNHDISMLVRLFLEELRYRQSGYEYMVENIGLLIVGNLMRQIKHNLSSESIIHILPQNNEEIIKTVIDYMNENYTAGVSCSELADLVKMDKFCFIRSFKAKTSKTPYEYLLDLKIEKAKKMLKANNCSITEISMLCGFSSHSHFTSTFKKKVGVSPSAYRINC
jgi:AraC-like DNA-binding protein